MVAALADPLSRAGRAPEKGRVLGGLAGGAALDENRIGREGLWRDECYSGACVEEPTGWTLSPVGSTRVARCGGGRARSSLECGTDERLRDDLDEYDLDARE